MKLTFIQRDLWLKIMKATSIVCILATVLLSTAHAHGVSGQQVLNQRLSLNVKNESGSSFSRFANFSARCPIATLG